MSKYNFKIGFIGGGNMATAICEGLVKKELFPYSQIYVSGPGNETLKRWAAKGANTTNSNSVVVEECEVIILSMKPHMLKDALSTVKIGPKTDNKLFISILAGITIVILESNLSRFNNAAVIRVMPNTPMMVGEGCSVYCAGKNTIEKHVDIVKDILGTSGIYECVPESMINAVGALAGSGPAYIYLVIEAMSDGAVRMGVPRDMATKYAAQTVLGAGKMVLATGKHTGQLKDEVCSPGGTTITGVHELERGGVRSAVMNAIECATKRSFELGK